MLTKRKTEPRKIVQLKRRVQGQDRGRTASSHSPKREFHGNGEGGAHHKGIKNYMKKKMVHPK